jgi:hypothetical protein
MLLLAAALCTAGPVAAQPATPKPLDIHFPAGSTGTTLKGTVKGDGSTSYRLVAGAGQTLSVELKPSNASQYFNIIAPGSNEAMFIGSSDGSQAKVLLPIDGAYTIQAYLMRNAARRNETSNYTMQVSITGAPLQPLSAAQDAKVAGTPFHATAPVPCTPPYGAKPTTCEAGVIRRGRDGTATVVINGPNQLLRQILFVKGQPVASNSAQPVSGSRSGDTTTVQVGSDERYEIPDAFLNGG